MTEVALLVTFDEMAGAAKQTKSNWEYLRFIRIILYFDRAEIQNAPVLPLMSVTELLNGAFEIPWVA